MLQIYDSEPSNWQELQTMAARIFADIGFDTEVEKDIKLVRGTVNVDIYSVFRHLNIQEVHITECKYWATSVPKSVVHSVRTILADTGANSGYIISREGFQKGAYEAAENSNLYLFTFNEFQEEFRNRWLDRVVDDLEIIGYPLRKYSSPLESFYEKELRLLSNEKQKEYLRLSIKYNTLSYFTARRLYKDIFSGKLLLDDIDYWITKNSADFPIKISVNCLMEYFQYLKIVSIEGVNEFDNLFNKKLRKD
jgi:hypothetical protein